MDYATIKREARRRGLRVGDLIALSEKNDPFYTGRPAEIEQAQWFADLWRRFGYGKGVHLRRVHYQAVSQDPPLVKPDGTPYANTDHDWTLLVEAGKYARYLGLVDAGAFVDRRNPDPDVYARYDQDATPDVWLSGASWYESGEITFPSWPGLEVSGYDDANLQPYHLEVWVEKTTMNDVLEPLCRRYGANLVTGAGEMSITSTIELLDRLATAGRPCRVFYVSDYDPAGYGMPVSVARKLEFWHRERDLDVDIRLQPIALTRDQVIAYGLPRQPIKDSETRKGAFEDAHGEGAVELDAIEALHPGELTAIVEREMLRYYDPTVAEAAREQRARLAAHVADLQADALADIQPELDALQEQFTETVAELQERIRELRQATIERLEAVEVDTEPFPVPEGGRAAETDSVLYASERDYFEQLAYYKAHQAGETEPCREPSF